MTVMVFDGGEGRGEDEYQRWLDDHSRGFVINILRGCRGPMRRGCILLIAGRSVIRRCRMSPVRM